MDEHLAALQEAFAAAGIDPPDNPLALDLSELDGLVADKQLRGKCKSALVKFRRAAEAAGWQPSPAAVPAPAPEAPPLETAPEPTSEPLAEAPAPAPEPATVTAPAVPAEPAPLSAELQALHEALAAACAAAGIPVPNDPVGLDLNELDTAVEDKQLRGKVKAALVKFRRQAATEGWSAASAPAPAAAPAAAVAPPPPTATEPEMIEIEVEVEVEDDDAPAGEAAPMSAELAEKYAALQVAFTEAGAAVPTDPLAYDPNALDEVVEDKKLRGRVKSALVKFRRQAEAEGWTAGPGPRPKKTKLVKKLVPRAAVAETPTAPAAPTDAPEPPVAAPTELWLLIDDGWRKLGTATRQPVPVEELVGAKTAAGAVARITNILLLDGQFEVPEDLYNTYCWLAHEDVVYRAYYISHIGDVRRGTKQASLKIDECYSRDEFARAYVALGKVARPTADDFRLRRFGRGYHTDRRMFAGASARVI